MRPRPTSILLAVMLFGIAAAGQTVAPRDANEAEAWGIYREYLASKRSEAQLEAAVKSKFNDATMAIVGVYGIFGADSEAAAEGRALKSRLDALRVRQAEMLLKWDQKFYWRYGDLRWSSDRIKDVKTGREMDRIEYAMTYFPFDPSKTNATKTPATTGGTTVAKGKPGDWGQVIITFSGAVDLTSTDSPGWRNNGTVFKGKAAGPIKINIEVIGKADVSYEDYTVNLSIRAPDGKMIRNEKKTIPRSGGSVSYNLSYSPGSDAGDLELKASITGGNPEYFTYYVSGRLSMAPGTGTGSAARDLTEGPTPIDPAKATEVFRSGNDYAVSNGGTPPTFVFSKPTTITEITSYHWNNGKGAPAGGTLSIRDQNGKVYGPWKVSVRNNYYWDVRRLIELPPGTYTLYDSEPATWSQNSVSGGKGMVIIKGI